jgi:hypothetical protein
MKILGVLAWPVLVGLLMVTGCKSNKHGGNSHAAIEVTGHSNAEIQAATVGVFADHGYQLRTNTPTTMTFDRPATSGEKFKFGDWMNDGMVMQIKVRFEELPDESSLLRADVYVVQDPTNANFRHERRLTLWSTRSYQKLLENVRTKLNSLPPN